MADESSPNFFPFDEPTVDDWTENAKCSNCHLLFSEHNPLQIINCALAELRGGKG